MKKDNDGLGCVVMLLMIPIGYLLYGFVLNILWGWFIVPTFHAPPLSIPIAIGVAITISYITTNTTTELKSNNKTLAESAIETTVITVARPTIALLVGYIVHLFV